MFGLPTKRAFPTPRLTADDYYRFAIVPQINQAQAGIGVGAGRIGRVESAARLTKTSLPNGLTAYTLTYPKGV